MNIRLFRPAALCTGIGIAATIGFSNAQDAKKDVAADPAAVAMLKEAHDRRETFPPGFAGLTADLKVVDNGEVKGTFEYTSSGEVKTKLDGATKDQESWAKDELDSAFSHRRADDFAHGDGSHPITFDADDHSPLGRQLALNDKGGSHYRVLDGHLTQVNRAMGPTMKFSITVMANRDLPSGKYLPSQFTVTVFDNSGNIKEVEMYTDHFKQVGSAWVPSSRRVISTKDGTFTSRSFALDNIKLAAN